MEKEKTNKKQINSLSFGNKIYDIKYHDYNDDWELSISSVDRHSFVIMHKKEDLYITRSDKESFLNAEEKAHSVYLKALTCDHEWQRFVPHSNLADCKKCGISSEYNFESLTPCNVDGCSNPAEIRFLNIHHLPSHFMFSVITDVVCPKHFISNNKQNQNQLYDFFSNSLFKELKFKSPNHEDKKFDFYSYRILLLNLRFTYVIDILSKSHIFLDLSLKEQAIVINLIKDYFLNFMNSLPFYFLNKNSFKIFDIKRFQINFPIEQSELLAHLFFKKLNEQLDSEDKYSLKTLDIANNITEKDTFVYPELDIDYLFSLLTQQTDFYS